MGIGPETSESDQAWMRHAFRLAKRAQAEGEVPIGAVIVRDEQCIGEGWNSPIALNDPTAHAEIQAIRNAGAKIENYRLVDTTMYVTLEPCVMCMGAIVHARIARVVFAAHDEQRGAVCSALNLADAAYLNHRVDWSSGVLSHECSEILRDFFKIRRK